MASEDRRFKTGFRPGRKSGLSVLVSPERVESVSVRGRLGWEGRGAMGMGTGLLKEDLSSGNAVAPFSAGFAGFLAVLATVLGLGFSSVAAQEPYVFPQLLPAGSEAVLTVPDT